MSESKAAQVPEHGSHTKAQDPSHPAAVAAGESGRIGVDIPQRKDVPRYRVREVWDWRELERWQSDWEELALNALEPAPSSEAFFLVPSLRRSLPGHRVRVVLVFAAQGDDAPNALCGVFPVHERRIGGVPAPIIEIWNHLYSLEATPLIRRHDANACLAAFFAWAREQRPSHTLLRFPEVRAAGAFHARLCSVLGNNEFDYSIERCWARAFFRPARDADSYIGSLGSAHHLKEWRRLERRLGEQGTVTYHSLAAQDHANSWIDAFVELEQSGWKGRTSTAFGSNPSHRAWLTEMATEAFARGRLSMLALRLNGEPIALKLNVRTGDGGHTFKIAYDERYEKYSPGVLLELENIRRLHDDRSIAWMDSLAAPEHALMERVWCGRAAFLSLVIAPGRTPGRLLHAAYPLLRFAKRMLGRRNPRGGSQSKPLGAPEIYPA